MKATELFYHAIVQPLSKSIGSPCQVIGVDYESGLCDLRRISDNIVFRCVPCTALAPIPLIPEILEKIGFSCGYTATEEGCDFVYEKGWCYCDENGEVKVTFPQGKDGGEIYVNDYSFRYLRLVFPDKIYLHELQHALKLGGIEKEIVL